MNKLIIVVGILVIGYFVFFNKSKVENTIFFQNKKYEMVEDRHIRQIQNYFYTLNGVNRHGAGELIHIVVCDEGVSEKVYNLLLNQLKSNYNLKLNDNIDNEYFGIKDQQSFRTANYGVSFKFKNQYTIAIYLNMLVNDKRTVEEIKNKADDIFSGLESIKNQLH